MTADALLPQDGELRLRPGATSKRHIASELLKQTDRSDPLFENNRTRVIAAGYTEPILQTALDGLLPRLAVAHARPEQRAG